MPAAVWELPGTFFLLLERTTNSRLVNPRASLVSKNDRFIQVFQVLTSLIIAVILIFSKRLSPARALQHCLNVGGERFRPVGRRVAPHHAMLAIDQELAELPFDR